MINKRRSLPKVFFGWWTVLGSGILALWGYGYHAYGFSALFKPISQELGFSRATTSVAASIGRFEGGIESPITGWITDRYGPRWIVRAGVFLIGVSLILMYFVNSLWAFYVVWGVMLGTGINIALGLPLDAAISNWFVKKRGLALSIKQLFQGLSGTMMLPLIAWLIVTQGWRMTVLIGGVVMLVVGMPISWLCIKQHRPEFYGLLPDGVTVERAEASKTISQGVAYATEVQEVEFTLRQATKTPAYWLLIASNSVHALFMPVMNIHAVPFLTDMGIAPFKAAAMMSLYVTASLPARFVGGFIGDRVKKGSLPWILGGAYLLQAIGVGVYLLHPTITMIYVWFVLYGLGMGIGNIMPTLIRGRYFGRKAFGSLMGLSSLVSTPVGVLAPIYVGWIYDSTGSYMPAFMLFAIALALSGVLISFARPPKPPAQITDVHKIV